MIFEEKINKVKMQFIINSNPITAGVKSAILQKNLILSSYVGIFNFGGVG